MAYTFFSNDVRGHRAGVMMLNKTCTCIVFFFFLLFLSFYTDLSLFFSPFLLSLFSLFFSLLNCLFPYFCSSSPSLFGKQRVDYLIKDKGKFNLQKFIFKLFFFWHFKGSCFLPVCVLRHILRACMAMVLAHTEK